MDCDNISSSLNVESSIANIFKIREKSSLVWHKRLGHISKERVEKLIREDILSFLNFNDLGTCVNYIRVKFTKVSFEIIMALVAYFDLELHQMDVKITFLNGDLNDDMYTPQPEGFMTSDNDHFVCKLINSTYDLK